MPDDPEASYAEERAGTGNAPSLLPLASIYGRTLAIIIDSVTLYLIGKAIAMAIPDVCYASGLFGRLIGFAIVCLYFGAMESSPLGNGQSFGKLILGIAVRNREGKPLSFGAAVCRTAIYYLPSLIYVKLGMASPTVASFSLALSLGTSLAIVFPIVFSGSRKGLHDFLCGSNVLFIRGKPTEAKPPELKPLSILSGIVAGALLCASLLAISYSVQTFVSIQEKRLGSEASKLRDSILEDRRITIASVSTVGCESKLSPDSLPQATTAYVKVYCKAGASNVEMDAIACGIVAKAEESSPYDILIIELNSRYDIMIARGAKKRIETKNMPCYIKSLQCYFEKKTRKEQAEKPNAKPEPNASH